MIAYHHCQILSVAYEIVPWRGEPITDLKPRQSLRYGRKSVFQAKWRQRIQLTPGSGPRRTPRRGAAGSDASSPLLSSSLPRMRVQLPQTPPAQAVEDAPDAHGGQRRPSYVRVCCRTRTPCVALCALRPGPACASFATTLNFETLDIHHRIKADFAAF
ncbi:hypothetical protein EVAR_68611_1 [Eumeta japonica]|uniref:Uncharacterized protein n=1 Tax=Eumeta variegata TaxID=151549 RepID=A0A4C1ZIC3_EUMVA|nr:hypothetical protein EVAR_68611_1 [Eumeta japonica]